MSIENHEWSDGELSVRSATAGEELILVISDHFDDGTARAGFDKQDAIAIAQHFGLLDKAIEWGKARVRTLGNEEGAFIASLTGDLK